MNINDAKKACLAAAENGFQVLPAIGLFKEGNPDGCRQAIKKEEYLPCEKVISKVDVESRWGVYEGLVKSGEGKYRTEAQMMILYSGQHIKGGYALLGIDIDFEDKAKIEQIESVLKRSRTGTLIAKRGSKGVCYLVKTKLAKFSPYKCAGGTKKSEAETKFPVDWLVGAQGVGHYMNFVPPGINLKTKKPYEWLTEATIYNTPATELVTVGTVEYHEICQICGTEAVNKNFVVKGEQLATRIARIKQYVTSKGDKPGEFEPNLLDDCTFFGRLIKAKNTVKYLPTAEGFANWYYALWQAAYDRDGKKERPPKSVDYIVEKIKGTEAPADDEGDGYAVDKADKDKKEADYWIKKHGIDELSFYNGLLHKHNEERGCWMPINETGVFNEITNRKGCGAAAARSAMIIIVNEVKMNVHSLEIDSRLRRKNRDALSKIAFRNTTVSITSDGIKCGPSKKEDYVMYGLDCDYKPEAKCPMTMEQLNRLFTPDAMEIDGALESDDEVIARRDQNVRMVLQFLGYSMTPYNGFAKSLFIHGASRTGKSMIANVFQRLIEGDDGRELICPNLSINEFSEPNALAMVRGKLLAICADDDGNPQKKDISVWKRWTGGDPLTVKVLYKDVETIRPTAKYMHISNTRIDFRNTDPVAAAERLISIKSTSQTIPKEIRDVNFIEKLTTKEELEGFAALLIANLADLYKAGRFELADWQERDNKEITASANPVGEYIDERLSKGWLVSYDPQKHKGGDRITTEHLKEEFLIWMNTDTRKRDMQYWGSKQRIADSANAWLRENDYDQYRKTSVRQNGKITTKYVYPFVKGNGKKDETNF